MNKKVYTLFVLIGLVTVSLFSMTSFAEINNKAEDLEVELLKALDKHDKSPLSDAVIHEIQCQYLVLDFTASLVLLSPDDAQYTVFLQEALINKVYGGSFSQLLEFWQNNKQPMSIMSLCPKYSEIIENLLEEK